MKARSAMFESFANSKRYKTNVKPPTYLTGLRALLIQKDTKRHNSQRHTDIRLRALLIQKDTKRHNSQRHTDIRLRALLIQKDTKLMRMILVYYSV